jgi:hypothetical protein
MILGQKFYQLCLPKGQREVLRMGHDSFGGHLDSRASENPGKDQAFILLAHTCIRHSPLCSNLCVLSKEGKSDM